MTDLEAVIAAVVGCACLAVIAVIGAAKVRAAMTLTAE